MFAHHCTGCDRSQLISVGRVDRIDNTDRGIVVAFRCWCGTQQHLVTGRGAPRPRARHAA